MPTQIQRIVFAIGINDRTNSNPPTINAITQLRDALTTRQRPTTFLAVPHFEDEPQDMADGTQAINLTLADLFGNDFVQLPADLHHFSTGTAHDIVSLVSSAVDALN